MKLHGDCKKYRMRAEEVKMAGGGRFAVYPEGLIAGDFNNHDYIRFAPGGGYMYPFCLLGPLDDVILTIQNNGDTKFRFDNLGDAYSIHVGAMWYEAREFRGPVLYDGRAMAEKYVLGKLFSLIGKAIPFVNEISAMLKNSADTLKLGKKIGPMLMNKMAQKKNDTVAVIFSDSCEKSNNFIPTNLADGATIADCAGAILLALDELLDSKD